MSICVGIDPGLDGGVAVLSGDGSRLVVFVTPTLAAGKNGRPTFDVRGMRGLLANTPLDGGMVAIEAVHAMPKQGVTSSFTFGYGCGLWAGLLTGLNIPFQAVIPQAWKRSILAGTKRDKQAAIELVARRFPDVSLMATPRSRKPHDGLADAACLALYARTILNGKAD